MPESRGSYPQNITATSATHKNRYSLRRHAEENLCHQLHQHSVEDPCIATWRYFPQNTNRLRQSIRSLICHCDGALVGEAVSSATFGMALCRLLAHTGCVLRHLGIVCAHTTSTGHHSRTFLGVSIADVVHVSHLRRRHSQSTTKIARTIRSDNPNRTERGLHYGLVCDTKDL